MITTFTYKDYLDREQKIAKKNKNKPSYNKQLATAYIIFMMLGSEYYKCSFDDKNEEQRLYAKYKGMSEPEQLLLEDEILGRLEKITKIPGREQMACEVSTHMEGRNYCMFFKTYFGEVEFLIEKNGRFKTNVFLKRRRRKSA